MIDNRGLTCSAVIGLVTIMSLVGVQPEVGKRLRSPERHRAAVSAERLRGNLHLGAEYYNISSALANGRGFADPFYVRSGPTAWMPPLLVGLQAPLIWLFAGDRFWVMLVVVCLKSVVLCGCGIAVVRLDWSADHRGWLGFGVFATYVVSEQRACFEFTHDGWLILVGVTATILLLPRLQHLASEGGLRFRHSIGWGVVGGLVALSSPAAGVAWAVATTICLARRAAKHWILTGVVSFAVITPWLIRNYVVFERLIPIKSNAYFELDQSFALDRDGVLSSFASHPYMGGKERDLYVRLGETEYLESKKRRFQAHLRDDPGGFRSRVRNRAVAATLWPAWFPRYWAEPGLFFVRWLIYPIPAIAIVLLVMSGRAGDPLKKYAVIVYLAYLMPYVLCSYYPRYGFPLLTLKVMLMYWAAAWLAERRRARVATS